MVLRVLSLAMAPYIDTSADLPEEYKIQAYMHEIANYGGG